MSDWYYSASSPLSCHHATSGNLPRWSVRGSHCIWRPPPRCSTPRLPSDKLWTLTIRYNDAQNARAASEQGWLAGCLSMHASRAVRPSQGCELHAYAAHGRNAMHPPWSATWRTSLDLLCCALVETQGTGRRRLFFIGIRPRSALVKLVAKGPASPPVSVSLE